VVSKTTKNCYHSKITIRNVDIQNKHEYLSGTQKMIISKRSFSVGDGFRTIPLSHLSSISNGHTTLHPTM
jgi:hypothetical protein